MAKRPNPRKLRAARSYTVIELADALEVSAGTVNLVGDASETIYVNGVATGTLRSISNTTGTETFTEDISGLSAGDLIQIYGYDPSNNFPS